MQFYRSLPAEAVAIRRATARAGCIVRSLKIAPTLESVTGVVSPGAPDRVLGRIVCADGWGAGRLLLAMAIEDSLTPGACELAKALRREAPTDGEFARALHSYIQTHVKFERESVEEFESPGYTLEQGAGDCDAHFRVYYAIAAAGGLRVALALLHRGGGSSPAHALAVVDLGDGWTWAETTVRAFFGESPNEAARRLGLTNERTDIAKEVKIMTEKDLAAVPARFRERNSPTQTLLDAEALQRLGYLAAGVPACLLSDPTFPVLREAVLAFQVARAIVPDGLLGPTTRMHLAAALVEAGPEAHADFPYPGIGDIVAAPVVVRHSADLSDEFLQAVIEMVARFAALGAKAAPEEWAAVWIAESGMRNIPNHAGEPYAGLNQMGPTERKNCGFDGSMADWLALTLLEQLPFVECFYKSAAKMGGGAFRFRDAAALYVANIAPAYMSHADEPNFPLYTYRPREGMPSLHASNAEWAEYNKTHSDPYAENHQLDRQKKGFISVDDMRIAVMGVANGSQRFAEVRDRLRALGAAPPTPRGVAGGVGAVAIVLGMLSAGAWAAWNAATT